MVVAPFAIDHSPSDEDENSAPEDGNASENFVDLAPLASRDPIPENQQQALNFVRNDDTEKPLSYEE